jgi:hypothetical protein
MMNVERFKNCMAFQPVDRLPAIESFPWWDQTLERWYAEGLPRSLTDAYEIGRWFGLDMHRWWWMSPRWDIALRPRRSRQQGLVDDPDEYAELVEPFLREPHFSNPPYYDERALARFAEERKAGDVFLWLQIDGFFWFARECMGVEKHLYAFHDQAEFLHRINADLVDYTLALLKKLFQVSVPDVIAFAEDVSYNRGPMISRASYDEFISPYYRKIIPFMKEHGCTPIIDTDGLVDSLIPWLEEDGIEGASPMERQAANDLGKIRRDHPGFKMMGGFDKRTIHQGEEAMREEFERILPVMRSGGYIPSVDHQTPPDVSLEMYQRYASLLREYCGKAGE